jgi:hypothetical protein
VSVVFVVHYIGATKDSRSVAASVVADQIKQGHQVRLIDLSRFTTINQDLPPRWLAKLLGHNVQTSAFTEAIAGMGANHTVLLPLSTIPADFPTDIKEECEQAIESEMLTYFRRDSLSPETLAIRSLRKKLTHQAKATHEALSVSVAEHTPDVVIIPNGRTSRQKVARRVAERYGATVMFYETGRAKRNSYYLGTTQPHDRVASQAEVSALTAHLTPDAIEQMASQWLEERTSLDSGINSFSEGWAAAKLDSDGEHRTTQRQATFFSSSADEFLAFGPMWNIDSWESQFQAFDLVMAHFEKLGVSLVLRLHPNLTGKSRRYFLDTVRNVRLLKARHPGLVVHWHNSPVNSYDLVKNSDYIVAERSTIGLESNLMGKPVWINQAAQWDVVADVRQLLGPQDVTEENLRPWLVDPRGAQTFVAYWMLQEHPLSFSWRDWASWNPDSPPERMRLALLWVANPWLHRVHLIVLAWYWFLNSRFKGSE